MLNTLKQIFQLESVPCVCLHDFLTGLLAKVCFVASFMCLSRFLAFPVTFNELCCGLLSCIHLWLTDQGWHTGPNESALHFVVVFVVC